MATMEEIKLSKEDVDLILKVATKAEAMYNSVGVQRDRIEIYMDLKLCHGNCPLDLQAMLDADENGYAYDFSHDIGGIARHLNRDTGKLEDFFMPRFAKHQ